MNLEYSMSDRKISIVCYAHDATIKTNSEDDLQRQPYAFYTNAKEFNMVISIEKTSASKVQTGNWKRSGGTSDAGQVSMRRHTQ